MRSTTKIDHLQKKEKERKAADTMQFVKSFSEEIANEAYRGTPEQREAMRKIRGEERNQFPIHLLGKTIENYINNLAEAKDFNRSAIANSIMATCAGAIGNKTILKIDSQTEVKCILWLCTVMESATGKSPIMRYASMPIQKLDIEEGKRYKMELENASEILPILKTRLIKNTTIEGLYSRLDDNGGSVLMLYDELSTLLDSFGAYKSNGSGDEAEMLSLWNGEPIDKTRANKKNNINIDNQTVSIIANSPNQLINTLLSNKRAISGFFTRWQFVMPKNVKTPRETDIELDESLYLKYENLVNFLFDSNPKEIKLNPEAKKLAKEYNNDLADRADKNLYNSTVRAIYGKSQVNFLRFALLLSQIRFAETKTHYDVIEEDVEKAIKITEYYQEVKLELFEVLSMVNSDFDKESTREEKIDFVFQLIENRQLESFTKKDLVIKLATTRPTLDSYILKAKDKMRLIEIEKKNINGYSEPTSTATNDLGDFFTLRDKT